MGREKRTAPGVGTGEHAKERHKRDRRGNLIDWTAPLPPGLVARPERPRISSGHKSWFELIENKDKKKKLEFEYTERRDPPPGFEFVPIGNPALTTACKELSREQDAMIFIVTSMAGLSKRLSSQLNRVGYHIRQTIVDQARATLGDDQLGATGTATGLPEPIPERQEDINKQADAAIRDLFPRIPNTDRQVIIEHAFNKSNPGGKDGPPVGLAPDINLSRRVQLAVLAHIRHSHTRYDQLLKETTYVNARKAVESLCLDVLVKWRGDEETGRDQLDEILCEVIVISESESDESDDDDDEDDSSDTSSADENPAGRLGKDDGAARMIAPPVDLPPAARLSTNTPRGGRPPRVPHVSQKKIKKASRRDRRAAKWAQRGFNRYQAAWHEAVERQRHENDGLMQHSGAPPMGRSASHGPQSWRTAELSRLDPALPVARNLEPSYHAFHAYGAALPHVDVSRERASRAHEQAVTYHTQQQQAHAQDNPPMGGFRPVIGSRAVPEVERVSYRGQDLKDYLVQSIEPASPRPSNFPPRSSIASHQPERGLPHGGDNPVREVRPRAPVRAADEITAAQGLHPIYAEEGFIRLPPRSQSNRMPVAPDPRSEPFILLNPLPVSSAAGGRVVAATADGLGLRHSSTWQDDAAARGRDLGLRTGARPSWIGHDGVVLRSESRPIVIQDYPSPTRQQRVDAAYAPLESRRLSPTRWVDARHVGPGEVDERDRRHADSGIEQRIETLQDDFVEIVRVSSKFPRQHEPRPASAGPGMYNLRSAPAQQNVPWQPIGSVARHDTRRLAQGQRLERVVGRVEVPVFPDENGYQRQERVVGIEYIHPRPSLETRTYSDRGPFFEAKNPVYRSRSNSVAPLPHSGLPYHQTHTGRPTPKRDEVIMLD